MPMPTTIPSNRSGNDSPFTFISPPPPNMTDSTFAFVTSPSTFSTTATPTTTTTVRDDYTMVNLAPTSNVIADDDASNVNSLANATLSRLLALYNDAKLSNKNAELFAIYQELERRCTGANCTELTRDYPAVYDSKLNEHAHKAVSELKQVHAYIQQQIRARINNDVTRLHEVQKEYLIESAALLATIKQKDI